MHSRAPQSLPLLKTHQIFPLTNYPLFYVQFFPHKAAQKFDADVLLATFRNDHIRMAFRRLDKFEVHRSDRALILLERSLKGSSALGDVPSQAAHQTDIVRCIDKYSYV